MTERKRRTPQELIEEHQAKLDALQLKQALEEAKDNPSLQPLVSTIEDAKKELRSLQVLFSNSPQGFNARRTKHQLWIDEITAKEVRAQELAHILKDFISDATQALTEAADQLTTRGTLEGSCHEVFLGGPNTDLSNLDRNVEEAVQARKSFGKKELENEI